MKLALNAVPQMSPLTGIGQYVRALSTELVKLQQLEVVFFYGTGWEQKLREQGLAPAANQLRLGLRKYLPYSYELSRWAQQKTFSYGIKQHKPTLYHEPSFLTYQFDGPTVLTVHDLSWIRYPETHPTERVQAMDKLFEPSLRRAPTVYGA